MWNRYYTSRMNVQVEVFSKGKISERNEDFFMHDDRRFALADGATDKRGQVYDGKTGGEMVSQLITKRALETDLIGVELIDDLNKSIKALYERLNLADFI